MPRKKARKKSRKAAQKAGKDKRNVKLLEKGYVPDETKIGTSFKGKNKVVIL